MDYARIGKMVERLRLTHGNEPLVLTKRLKQRRKWMEQDGVPTAWFDLFIEQVENIEREMDDETVFNRGGSK